MKMGLHILSTLRKFLNETESFIAIRAKRKKMNNFHIRLQNAFLVYNMNK